MKSTLVALPLALLVWVPMPAGYAAPNECYWMGEEEVCTFSPTTDGDRLLLRTQSVVRVSDRSANFEYWSRRNRRMRYAQVSCRSSRLMWRVFYNMWDSEVIPVESEAARRLVDYVCVMAGF